MAVEDLALVEDDRLQEPVLADVGHELAELGAVAREEREQGGGLGTTPLNHPVWFAGQGLTGSGSGVVPPGLSWTALRRVPPPRAHFGPMLYLSIDRRRPAPATSSRASDEQAGHTAEDIRLRTFVPEATARLAFLLTEHGFAGPTVQPRDGRSRAGVRSITSVTYHHEDLAVETMLIVDYSEVTVRTELRRSSGSGPGQRVTVVGDNRADTGYQIRRALDRQAAALRTAIG